MIPYILFSIIGLSISIVFGLYDGQTLGSILLSSVKQLANKGTVSSESGHLWFLWGLFISRMALYASSKRNILKIVLLVDAFLILLLFHLGLKNFWWIMYSMTGFLFYGIGYIFKDVQYNKSMFLASSLIYVVSIIQPSTFNQYNTQLYCGIFEVAIIYAVAGCVFFNNVGKYLLCHKTIFSSINKYAMLLYVVHYPVMGVISKSGILCNMNNICAIILLNTTSFIAVALLVMTSKDKLNKIGL